MTLKRITLDAPYLLFMGDVGDDVHAKTGHGLAFWRPELCAGQMRNGIAPVADFYDRGMVSVPATRFWG